VLKTIRAFSIRRRARSEFLGKPIQRMEADKIVRLGLSHLPEGREVFPFLSVREKPDDGAYPQGTAMASPRISNALRLLSRG